MADVDVSLLDMPLRRYDIRAREEHHLPLLGDRRQLAVRRVARERWGPAFAFRVPWHPAQVIACVHSGSGVMLDHRQRVVELAAGAVIALGGGAHRSVAAGPAGMRVSLAVCAPGMAAERVRRFWGATNCAIAPESGHRADHLFALMHAAARTRSAHAQDICRHYLEIILRSLAPPAVGPDQGARATFRRCLELADDGQRSPAAIAAAAGIGVAHLCRLFRRFAGITPGAYRDRRRAALAEDLLADTDLSLGAIAERLGYPDAFAFSRAFKRTTGQAPSHWREGR